MYVRFAIGQYFLTAKKTEHMTQRPTIGDKISSDTLHSTTFLTFYRHYVFQEGKKRKPFHTQPL